MDLLYAAILGAIQGLTEFLPVSSTAHLILIEKFFGLSPESFDLSFDASLHLGTLFALLIFFWRDIVKIIKNFLIVLQKKTIKTPEQRLPIVLFLATVPGAILGILLENKIETVFRSPTLIALTLVLFSFVLLYVDKTGKKSRQITQITSFDGLLIGLAQAVALIPGVSRSGITLATGIWRGFTREASIRFTFLLSIPIILGAGGKQFVTTVVSGQFVSEWQFFLVGMFFAFLSGLLTIRFLLKYLQSHSLIVFVVYRIILGILVLFGVA